MRESLTGTAETSKLYRQYAAPHNSTEVGFLAAISNRRCHPVMCTGRPRAIRPAKRRAQDVFTGVGSGGGLAAPIGDYREHLVNGQDFSGWKHAHSIAKSISQYMADVRTRAESTFPEILLLALLWASVSHWPIPLGKVDEWSILHFRLTSPRPILPMMPEIPQSRPPLARMMRIHEQFQHGRRVNCSTMASLLEVSVKTAQRDIEFMRDQWHLPIEYDRSRHGYYYTREVTEFPALRVTEGEIVSLLVAQKALEQYRGTPFESTLETAFAKITSGLKDEVSFNPSEVMSGFAFRSVGTSKADLATFDTLSRGIRQRREVTITYLKPASSKPESRRIQPHLLANIQNLWYAICFDTRKSDFRRFALPRIKTAHLESTRFERQAGFSADTFLANSFGAFGGNEDIEVKIRFDAFAAAYIQERFWHPTEKFKLLPKGMLEFTMHVPRLEEVESWVLGWGAHAKVLTPIELVERLWKTGKALAAQYEKGS